jgi:hypothetical protein
MRVVAISLLILLHVVVSRNVAVTPKLVTIPPLAELPRSASAALVLGHTGLYHDFLALWTLQFLVDPKVKDEPVDLVARTLAVTARHQPKLESFYLLSCFVLAFDFKDDSGCAPIVHQGLEALPDSWRVPFTLGFLHLRANRQAEAAVFISLAASKKNSPQFLVGLAEKMRSKAQLEPTELKDAVESLLKVPGSKLEQMLDRSKDG